MTRTNTIAVIALCLPVLTCVQHHDPTTDLHNLFDEAWEFTMQEFPTFATAVGDHRFDDRLTSATIEDEARRAAYWRDVLARLETIDRSEMGDDDRINYVVFEREIRDRLASFEFEEYLIPITNDSGFHSGYPFLADLAPLRTTRDFENYIARLNAVPLAIDQHINLMRQGLITGHVQPQVRGKALHVDAAGARSREQVHIRAWPRTLRRRDIEVVEVDIPAQRAHPLAGHRAFEPVAPQIQMPPSSSDSL